MKKQYEFITENLTEGKMESVFYNGNMSLWEVANAEYNHDGNELNEELTLSNYFNPSIIEEYITEIINDNELYAEMSIEELTIDYTLYHKLNEKFDAEINI